MSFTQGQRVNTPSGSGTVNYQRMAPPTYSQAESVSVFLDNREPDRLQGKYGGTVFPAEKVTPIF